MTEALSYEFRRAISLRTTWVFLLVALVTGALLAWPQYYLSGASSGTPVSFAVVVTKVAGFYKLAVLLIASFGALSWGHEYRFGLNRLTLSAFPKRWPVLVAKTAGVIVFSAVAWAVSALGAVLLLQAVDARGGINYSLGSVSTAVAGRDGTGAEMHTIVAWHVLGRAMLFIVGYCLIVAAVTTLTRNLTLALIIPNIMLLFLEDVLSAVGNLIHVSSPTATANAVNQVLPFANGLRFAEWTQGSQFATEAVPQMQSTAVFGAWVLLLSILAAVAYQRRDA